MAKRNNRLLVEAIADAKAVKDTALANAKMALEEAFTPHLSSMLATRMRNEEDDELDLDLEMNDPIPAGDGHGSDEGGETDKDAVEKSSFTEAAVDVGSGVQSDGEKLKSSDIATGPENEYGDLPSKEPAEATRDSSDVENDEKLGMNEAEEFEFDDEEDELDLNAGAEMDMGDDEMGGDEMGLGGDEFGGEEEEDDLDLEAIIRELEADVDIDGEDEFEAPMGEEDGLDIELDDEEEDDMMGEEVDLPSAADGHGSDEGGETDNEAIRKKSFTQGQGAKQTGPISESDDFDDDDDDEIDLEEILREIEDEEDEESLEFENTELKSELKEYRTAVKFLRSKLNEVNLLNAKLLFTNKLFKNYNMNGSQKLRVVENFDRATTVRETKLVYTTLAESFKGKPVTRKRSITEGLASRAVGSTKSKKAEEDITTTSGVGVPTVLAEGKQLKERMQKLSGIIK